jgi:hypothetical protein
MNKTIMAALGAVSLLSLAACQKAADDTAASSAAAATGIDGTWKVDMATVQVDARPDQYMLKDGKFSCSTCTPVLEVAADGAFHPVSGRAYADSMAIKVDDDHNVTQTSKKGDKVTSETKYAVSDDGKTLKVSFNDTSGDKPVTGSLSETRVGEAPAGAHALSGSWKMAQYDNVSDEGTTVTYKLDGDTLHMSSPTGLSYDAKTDGSDADVKGDIGGTKISVTKTGDNSYKETNTRDGKVISTTEYTVDGNTAHVVGHDERDGSTVKYDMKRT